VEAVRQLKISDKAALAGSGSRVGGAPCEVRGRKFTLPDVDPARERSGVVVDPVVGDLQVMAPAVHEDGAAALGAVGDAQAVDAGRIAPEAARERIRSGCGSTGTGREQRRAGREAGQQSGIPRI